MALPKPFIPSSGFSYSVSIPSYAKDGDDMSNATRSTLVLCENGKLLGPAHSQHDEIRSTGRGRFSHWGGDFLFSTSDNSDPNANNREYSIVPPR
jgi:hypothetical protein